MAKHSNHRAATASPQRPTPPQAKRHHPKPAATPTARKPKRVGSTSSSLADGLQPGAPGRPTVAEQITGAGRLSRFMPRGISLR